MINYKKKYLKYKLKYLQLKNDLKTIQNGGEGMNRRLVISANQRRTAPAQEAKIKRTQSPQHKKEHIEATKHAEESRVATKKALIERCKTYCDYYNPGSPPYQYCIQKACESGCNEVWETTCKNLI